MTPIHVRSTAIAMRNLRIIVRTMAITCETSFHVTNFNIGPLEVQDEEKNRALSAWYALWFQDFYHEQTVRKVTSKKIPGSQKTAKKYCVSRDHDELLAARHTEKVRFTAN